MEDGETVKGLIEARARSHADRPCVRFKGRSSSFREVNDRANRLAHGLVDLGVSRGDRVAALLPNRLEFLDLWFACAKLGAVLVPLNPLLKGEALEYSVRDSGSTVIVLDASTRGLYSDVRAKTEGVRVVLDADDGAPAWSRPLADARSSGVADPDAVVGLSDPMCILYTSGTTGMPKGVVLPHYSYVNTGREFVAITGMSERDRPFTTLPLFHVNAQQTTTMGSMIAGVEFVLETKFSASTYWPLVRESGATIFNYIGSIVPILFKQEPRPDDRAHAARLGIGAAAPRDVIAPFETRFGVTLIEGYGLTETGTVATCNRANDRRVGSIGKPVSFAEVRVVDDLDRPVPPGVTGEIVVRPSVPFTMMLGYHGKAEATVAAWRNLWFHTGDLGKMDEDGFFQFVDRAKDCIRRRGENISSFLVQKIVLNHPAVLDVAAYGVPSDWHDGEDEVKVDVVLKPGASLAPGELVAFCRESMAEFMVPRFVQVREALPRTETERVQKFKLRAEGTARAWDRLAHEPRRKG